MKKNMCIEMVENPNLLLKVKHFMTKIKIFLQKEKKFMKKRKKFKRFSWHRYFLYHIRRFGYVQPTGILHN